MKISIQQVTDYAFAAINAQASTLGLPVYKRRLPKGVSAGIVIVATDVTFDDNQQAIFFALAYVPDVKSGGDYEASPKIDEIARHFAEHLDVIHPIGTSYRCELIGQSVEEAEDTRSHFVSNRYMFNINTE